MDERLYALNVAIQRASDAPGNFLLRGEYWIEHGKIDLAREDLLTAKTLAEEQLDTLDWGYIYQSYIDRAEALLKRLQE